MNADKLTSIFCQIDDFCKEFDQQRKSLPDLSTKSSRRGPKPSMSISEVATILVAFQESQIRHFSFFYKEIVMKSWGCYFPKLVSYSRFTSMIKEAMVYLSVFTLSRKGKSNGVYVIDSSSLAVCHNKRIGRHKTFKGLAAMGKTSVGWFFGLKIHIVINSEGELMAFKFTPGNRHDAAEATSLLSGLEGHAFADKGYIGKAIFEALMNQGLKLVTRKRRNMKNKPLSAQEEFLLNRRGVVETVIGQLKEKYHIWHTRHRSIMNALTHAIAALAAYQLSPDKIIIFQCEDAPAKT